MLFLFSLGRSYWIFIKTRTGNKHSPPCTVARFMERWSTEWLAASSSYSQSRLSCSHEVMRCRNTPQYRPNSDVVRRAYITLGRHLKRVGDSSYAYLSQLNNRSVHSHKQCKCSPRDSTSILGQPTCLQAQSYVRSGHLSSHNSWRENVTSLTDGRRSILNVYVNAPSPKQRHSNPRTLLHTQPGLIVTPPNDVTMF